MEITLQLHGGGKRNVKVAVGCFVT